MTTLFKLRTTAVPAAPAAVTLSMADVRRWLADAPLGPQTRSDYFRCVERCAQLYDGQPLVAISADLAAFHARWPIAAFDPRHFKTEPAYKAWRRKVIAAIKGFSGAFSAEAERRARQDDWSELIGRIEPHCGTPLEGAVHDAKILIGVRKLADLGRCDGVSPAAISVAWLLRVADEVPDQAHRYTVERAAGTRDSLRYLPEVIEMLPPEPFGSVAAVRRLNNGIIPAPWRAELDAWIDVTTRGRFDPIDDAYVDGHSDGSRGIYAAALHRYAGDALRLGLVDPADALDAAFRDAVFAAVVRHWRDTTDDRTGIGARTAAAYVSCIAITLETAGRPATIMRDALKTNRFLRRGRKANGRMTPKTRAFCERLLRDPAQRRRFLTQHLEYQKRAVEILAGRSPDALPPDERKSFVRFGFCAAFAAIECHGTPLRIGNILAIPMLGPGRWLAMPDAERDAARFLIPKEVVKNNQDLPFELPRGQIRSLEVLEWYVAVVRPLMTGAATSSLLFPKLETTRKSDPTYRRWFQVSSRMIGMPMDPHRFRHGAASILYDRHPGIIDHVAAWLGDTPATVRRYYAWIDEGKTIEQAQKSLLDIAMKG